MSLPVDIAVFSDGWFELFPNTPDWVHVLLNSGAYRDIHSLTARGLPTVELYINRLLHDGLSGTSLLDGGATVSGNSTAGNFTLGADTVTGSFAFPVNATGFSQLSLNLSRSYSTAEGIFIFSMDLSSNYGILPNITLSLYNSSSFEEIQISPNVELTEQLTFACNFSATDLFSLTNYDEIRITIYDPTLEFETTLDIEITRIELAT
jgi:hypothetical protein